MINANELRIGNYVHLFDNIGYFKIHLVCKSAIQVESDLIGGEVFKLDIVQPIKLDEDILLNCGFDKIKIPTSIPDFFIEYYKLGDFIVYLLSDFFEVELIRKNGEQFNLFKTFKKELHILQNIYSILEEQELKINL